MPFPIVAIGASAGGLEALQEFAAAIPSDSGLCYVVVQHLAPDHPSIMDQLLGARAAIPVEAIRDGQEAEADTMFIIPPGPSLTIEKGRFRLHDDRKKAGVRTPIDRFFTSLADDAGGDAFCVVLSGTGSDGTAGLKAIKAAGGIAVVQQSQSAKFPGMPDSAVSTGLVDFVLKPERIPARLIDIVQHRASLRGSDRQDELFDEIETRLPDILALLNEDGEGHDFTDYKPGTLVRRVERRMALLRHRTVQGFIDYLKDQGDERTRLLQEFLIGVTHFFRDPEMFEMLARDVVAKLVARDQQRFRLWVPGCATGEEAYSLAILMSEAMEAIGAKQSVQVFGTDIDGAALSMARQGRYPAGSVQTLSEERLERYFVRENSDYQISPSLREACIFSPHNVIDDPPFSRIDLISCRNLLIYLNTKAQRNILPRFHYALNTGGFLFLGPAEALGDHEDLFHPISKANRIFQRNDAAARGFSTLHTQRRQPRRSSLQPAVRASSRLSEPVEVSIDQKAEDFFLSRFALPFAVVNARNEIVYLSEHMTSFVQPTKGSPSAELDLFLTRELRLPVRATISNARKSGEPGRIGNIVVGPKDDHRLFDVEAMPMEGEQELIMVVLRELTEPDPDLVEAASDQQSFPERDQLERELVATRQQLDATLAEFETSQQELRSSNEELLSMNEELQSANEELETSREELQSINEELETMNAELNENNQQLQRANSDLRNLFESAEVATLFLDSQLCIRGFTPEITSLFGIRESDSGRPLSDMAQRFSYHTLEEDAEEVRRSLQPFEQEVTIGSTDETFIMRMRPYRTIDDRLDGFVLTFFDITTRKRQERLLQENEENLRKQYVELETLYDTTPIGLALQDRELRFLRINERLAEINGFPVDDHIGKTAEELIPEIDGKIREMQLKVLNTGEPQLGYEVHGTTPAEPDRERDWIADYYPVFDGDEVFAVGCCVREVTVRKTLERELKAYIARLQLAADRHPIYFFELDAERKVVWALANHPCLPSAEDVGKPFRSAVTPESLRGLTDCLNAAFIDMTTTRCDVEIEDAEHGNGTLEFCIEPLQDDRGQLRGAMLVGFDVTERKQSEDRKTLLLAELQHRVKNTLATILAVVRFTAKKAASVESMRDALTSRLQAISRTHDVLTSNDWQSASVKDLIDRELRPYATNQRSSVEFNGKDINLPPKQALAVGMALHELATNAIKHGALSDHRGHVHIELRSGAEPSVYTLEWKERGIDLGDETGRQGFGRFLLEQALNGDLAGETKLDFEPDGIRFRMDIAV